MTQETLNEELTDWVPLVRRTILTLLAVVLAIVLAVAGMRYIQAADPYIQAVLARQGDQQRGRAIFQMNCAVCHGIEASGEVGPDLRGVSDHRSKVSLIKQVISGDTPPMPQFQPSPQDMADLLKYLESL